MALGTNDFTELDDVVATPCRSHDRIDDTLRTWLELGTRARWGVGDRNKGVFRPTISSPMLQSGRLSLTRNTD